MKLMRYLGLVGLAVFLLIVYAVGPLQIIGTFLRLDHSLFLIALLVLIPMLLLKAFRQCLLINAFGADLGFLDSLKIWLIGFFFSIVSPGKSGVAIKSFYFSDKTGLPVGKGLAAVVVEMFSDVAVLFVFALVGFAGISFYFILNIDMISPMLCLFALFLLLAFFLTKKGLVMFFFKPFYNYVIPKRFKGKLMAGFDDFFEAMETYKLRKLLLFKIVALTAFCWVIIIIQYYVLALALQIDIPFVYLFAVMPIVNLLSALPIAFSGLGTREASLVFFLGLAGIAATAAVSFSLLMLFLNIVVGSAGLLLITTEKGAGFKVL